MKYSEAIQFLYELGTFGARPGLESPRRLAALAGNPQEELRFIHVAGTNGKGSTCALLESIYRAAGLRVGLFTSPHLVAFGERLQVNRQNIAEADLVRLVVEMQARLRVGWSATDETPASPTLFEVVTVMALRYFVEQRCDLVIWETGLGGRRDATNLVTPLASVITNVQFDHQQWLGDTLARIAAEKAGIIKPGVPVLTAAAEPEALAVIAAHARAADAPLTVVTPADTRRPPLDALELPLLGEHQRLNAALAVATVRALGSIIPVAASAVSMGLRQVRWTGRLQVVERAGQTVLLDGAHNAAGIESLAAALARYFPGRRPTLVLGVLADKDWQPMCARLAPLAARIVLTRVNSERTAAPEELVPACQRTNPHAEVSACGSLREALALTGADQFVVITGSLYLVGEALELLVDGAASGVSERGLNEWRAAR